MSIEFVKIHHDPESCSAKIVRDGTTVARYDSQAAIQRALSEREFGFTVGGIAYTGGPDEVTGVRPRGRIVACVACGMVDSCWAFRIERADGRSGVPRVCFCCLANLSTITLPEPATDPATVSDDGSEVSLDGVMFRFT